MNKKISFHNMPHSDPLEAHSNQKLQKIVDVLGDEAQLDPFTIELWLKANSLHPHHAAELHVKTRNYDINAHDEGTDMYVVVDNTIDKAVKIIKKEKDKNLSKRKNTETEKTAFNK